MNTRPLGNRGPRVSEIGFGAWAIGGGMWGGKRDEPARSALERAAQRGVTFFDTALIYGEGHSERLVGELLRAHKGEGLAVGTKVPPKTMRWPAGKGAKIEEVFPSAWIVECAEKSLRNLGVETIDLLQLHVWEEPWAEVDSWYETMTKLRDQGKIRLIGISLNSHEPETGVSAIRSGWIDAVQVIYNIFDQSPEDELFPACTEKGVGVIARVPFDESSLTGKLKLDTSFPAGDFRRNYFGGPRLRETVERVEALRPIIEAQTKTTLARGALRFCLSHPAVSTVIPGMRSTEQVDENCAASVEGPLPAAVLEGLRKHRWVREE